MKKEQIEKTFIPGSKWVYYKVYCGANTADTILIRTLMPLCQRLQEESIIDKWFFIRYADPEKHIRVRFHVRDISAISSILQKMHAAVEPYIENSRIWDIQIASYQRELQRYGKNTMEYAESFFSYDSDAVIRIVKESQVEGARFYNMLSHTDHIINCFIDSPDRKLTFLDHRQLSYKGEFNIGSAAKKQLSKKYRAFRQKKYQKISIDYTPFQSIASEIMYLEKGRALEMTLEDLLGSFIHMSINRAFQSQQRLYEMVIYDFLYQQCRSDVYKKKTKSP